MRVAVCPTFLHNSRAGGGRRARKSRAAREEERHAAGSERSSSRVLPAIRNLPLQEVFFFLFF